jgi:signal transduction histidine kinase
LETLIMPTIPGEVSVEELQDILLRLSRGELGVAIPDIDVRTASDIVFFLSELAHALDQRNHQRRKLEQITTNINAGFTLQDVLEKIYGEFREVVPYNRIGMALIEPQGVVRAYWAHSDAGQIHLSEGYAAPLVGSSLEAILQTGQPRILNDLVAYLETKPNSHSTRLIVREGMRSSLTCPLIVKDEPLGFLFFSSAQPGVYQNQHSEIFQQIASQLVVIVEKAKLISDLEQSREEIKHQNEALQRLDELKNTFIAIAAHDLRSPLSYILTSIELITGPDAALYRDHQKTFLEGIQRQVRHMVHLVDDLLDLGEIQSGRFKLHLQAIKLSEILEEAVRVQSQLAAAKGTQIELVMEDDGLVHVDPSRMRQVLYNLLSNGVKYSPPNSQVQMLVRRQSSSWRIMIVDQGPGIRVEDRPRLFQPYQRLSAKPTAGEKSTGLGLAICRSIIEAHAGSIGVDSTPGKGASFWFTLPDRSE